MLVLPLFQMLSILLLGQGAGAQASLSDECCDYACAEGLVMHRVSCHNAASDHRIASARSAGIPVRGRSTQQCPSRLLNCAPADLTTESQPHVVATLVERAEAAEVHTRQLQSELAALRQSASARAAAGGAGTAAAISAAEVSCRELFLFPDRSYYLAACWIPKAAA